MFFFSLLVAPPKITNLKIIGDLRENSKVTVTGTVTGGSEASSRVQWFKTISSTLNENGLEAMSASKIAKVNLLCSGYTFLKKLESFCWYIWGNLLVEFSTLFRHSGYL